MRRPYLFQQPEGDIGVSTERAPRWQDRSACTAADADLFFPERGQKAAPAKAICATCPVRAECLQHALDNGEKFGIWGGLSERQRRRIRRERARGAA